MNPDHLHLVLNQATSQLDRRREAPAPERVAVDGRSLADLLAFAAEYGALINFYDLADRVDGDWTVFFASDPSIALALLACLDLPRIGADLRRLLAEIRAMEGSSRRLRALRRPIGAGMRLVGILDRAHAATEGSLARVLRREIQAGLAGRLQRFAAHLAAGPDHGLPVDLAGLSAVWGLSPAPGGGAVPIARDRAWVNLLIALFQELIDLLLAVLHRLRDAAAQLLEASLQSEGHAPQSALYVAFAVLFRHAQDTVNRFPRKLVDFYYDTILRQSMRAAVPDQLYLTFTPDKDVIEAAVPKATSFPAGTDAAGATIGYAAERSLAVYATAVAGLSTLHVADAALMLDSHGQPVGDAVPALVLSGQADLADPAPFPPFGTGQAGTSGALTSVPATLGFAVSSPTLTLAGGNRIVHLWLTPTADSLDALMPMLTAIGDAAGGLAPLDVLADLLQDGFVLTYSTAAGWAAIDGYTVLPPASTGEPAIFDLSFTLKVGAEPVATGPGWTAPAIRAALLQQRVAIGNAATAVTVYPYAVLAGLALSALEIEVSVDDLDDLTLSTPNGAVDPSKPYALFGSPPVQYGSIAISAPELFLKRLDRLSLALDWYGLPRTATGFEGYYQGYVVDLDGNTPVTPLFENTTFQATIDVVDPGWWQIAPPASDAGPTYLFRTSADDPVPAADKPVLDTTGFDALTVEPATPPAYYDPTLSAIRLALAQPSYAFGDTLYARNVMAAALQEMPLAAACAEQCAANCKPPAEVAALAPALGPVVSTNADAPDGNYREAIAEAVAKVLPQLTGAALKAVNDGLDKLKPAMPADELATVRAGLRDALATVPQGGRGVLSRLSGWFNRTEPDAADVAQNLRTWLDGTGVTLGRATTADFARARTVLDAADRIVAAAADAETQPPAVARPQMAAAVLAASETLVNTHAEDMQACLKACMGAQPTKLYPNAPWLPMVSRLRLDYGARSRLPDAALDGDGFWHLIPSDQRQPVAWPAGGAVPLLAPQPLQGSLFIALTATVAQPTLLFQMTVGPAGWSSDPPTVDWAQAVAGGWLPLVPPDGLQGDGTNGLQNSGIVTLGLAPGDGPALLRLSVASGADSFPLLGGVAANALIAGWVGPGGAATLDTPVPPGTITKSDPPLEGIATIDQPLASFGGRSEAAGPPFQMWMAERLRHKDRAIQGWDYARLALAEFPALWQLGVVPARNDTAGRVRLIVVPGPATPGIADPAMPLADPQMLGEIGTLFESRISPFARLEIDNPPYLAVTVRATLEFSDADTVAAWIARLNGELVAWLSPWPDPLLGPRPADYYTTFAVGEFIRRRPYVRAILSLALDCPAPDGWCYLTSAPQHDLQGELVAAP